MKTCINLFVLIGIFLPSISTRHVQFYRKDYTYIEEFDAFYKIHWDLNGVSWNSAFLACEDEGATLFYPKAKGEWALVKNLTDQMSEAPNVTEIFVGLHDTFGLGEFITVDGHSTPYPLVGDDLRVPVSNDCIMMDIESGRYKVDYCLRLPDAMLPFVCKKAEDESCPTIDQGYQFSSYTKKCYKINNKPRTWQEAMQSCFMEGGTLVVVENSAEADVLRDRTELAATYFVGVRRSFSSIDYHTVKGQKFSDVYQNMYNDQSLDCGAVYRDNAVLLTTNTDCSFRLPFICEIEINTV